MRTAIVTLHAMQRAQQRIGARAKEIGIAPSQFAKWLTALATNALNAPDTDPSVKRTWTTPTNQRVIYGEFALVFDGSKLLTVYTDPKPRRKGEVILSRLAEKEGKKP